MPGEAAKRFLYPSTVALEALARASAAAAKVRAAALGLSTYASFRVDRRRALAQYVAPLHPIDKEFLTSLLIGLDGALKAAGEAVEAITAYLSIVEGAARNSGVRGADRLAKASKALLLRYKALAAARVRLGAAYNRWLAAGQPKDPQVAEMAVEAIRKALNFGLYAPVAVEEVTAVARELGLLGRFKEVPQLGEPAGFSGPEEGSSPS